MSKSLVYDGFAKIFKTEAGIEVVKTTDSAGFIVHVVDKDVALFVRQRREAMVREDNPEGWITEIPAGRFDRDYTILQLLQLESKGEFGGNLDETTHVEEICPLPLALSPGIITERMTFRYVRLYSSDIEEQERVFGEAEEGERITRVWVKIEDLPNMVVEDAKTFLAVQWFLNRLRQEGRKI